MASTRIFERARRSIERGSLTIFFAILALGFMFVAVTLAEGARRLSNTSRAEDLASEAARAVASTIDIASLATGDPTIDTVSADGAMAQAELILEKSGVESEIVDLQIASSARAVTVRVRIPAESWLPGFDVSGIGTHTAQVFDPAEVGP